MILVVDDLVFVRKFVETTLEQHGYEVASAEDGARAMAIVHEKPELLEMILTDNTMPVMDGLTLANKLKGVCPHVPVVSISGDLNSNFRREMQAEGVRWFLPKPFTAEELMAVVGRALANPPSSCTVAMSSHTQNPAENLGHR